MARELQDARLRVVEAADGVVHELRGRLPAAVDAAVDAAASELIAPECVLIVAAISYVCYVGVTQSASLNAVVVE